MKNTDQLLAKATILVIAFSLIAGVSLHAQDYSADKDADYLNEIALNESFTGENESDKSNEMTRLPSFTMGGEYANISQYVADNLEFPETAIATGTSGILKMRIKILSDGSVGETTIIESPGSEFSNAVIALIGEMPKWNPAFTGNKAVDSVYTLHLKFRLQ